MREFGEELGFAFRDGRYVLRLDDSPRAAMASDLRSVARDMRTVMERKRV